jgi:hypothetical protein
MAAKTPPSVDTPYSTTTITTTTNARQISTVVDVSSTTSTASASAKKISTVVDTPYTTTVSSPNISNVAVTLANTTDSTADTSTAADSYYASGVGGLNNLVESGRVFRGANVYVTLEEQRYITNNTTVTGDGGNGTPGGANTQVQFNDTGVFGGDSGLTFNKNTNALTVAGNISGSYFFGNGSQLTGITAESSYGNSNVTTLLSAFGSNTLVTTGNVTGGNILTAGIVSATGNVSGNYFIGNGSQLTGISSGVQSRIANGTSNVNIATANGNVTVTANAASTWTFGTDSTLTLPAGSSRITSYGQITIETDNNASGMYLNADGVNLLYANANVTLRANSIGTNKDWNFGNTGVLTLPNSGVINASGNSVDIGSDDAISLEANAAVNIYTDTNGTTYQWQFGDAGELTLPASSEITEVANPGGFPGYAMALAPDVNNAIDADQQLLIYPTGGADANHLHLTSGNLYNTELFLGNDNLYVKLANTGNVVVNSNDDTGNSAQWTFGTSGNLTLPMGGVVYETNIPDGALSGSAIALKPTGGTNADQQLLIYPTVNDANHLHLTTGNLYNTELFLGDDNLYVKLANTGNVVINSNDDVGNSAQWNFDTTGNLTLPGNIIAINYANGNRVTGGVTFDGEAVIGTGTSNTQSGLYLAPDPVSLTNDLYLRVRGNILDEPTHIHFDTGNNQYYNLIIGDDNKYVQLANTGNIVINTNNYAGNTAQWNFDTDGTTQFPGSKILAPVSESITMQSDQYSQLMWENANVTVAPNMAINSNFYVSQNNATLDIAKRDGSGTQVTKSWYWNADGTLTLPTAGRINFDYLSISSDANVSAFYAPAGNVQLAAGIGDAQIVANSLNDSKTWTFGNTGNLTAPGNVSAVGNVTAGNISAGSGTITGGNVNGANFNGNVAFGTGTVGGSGNITGGNLLFGSGVVSGTGNISAGNISVTGNITGNTAGFAIGYRDIPQVSLSSNVTTALTDAGKHYYSTSASNLALTIANNTSVSWSVGTAISIVNRGTANITIAGDTGVSLYLAGNSSAGNRVVTTYGMATVMNVAANIWMISGTVV